MNYDVFISCKSEDYKYAEEIYNFLSENGINTFLSSRELRKMGESEYRSAISNAMKSAYHLIIFASKPEYVDSTWVYYEWDMFLNAKLKGYKNGQILTILKDIKVDDINMDLWKYESFKFEEFKERILYYVETPESLKRKEDMEHQKKIIEEKKKHRKELETNLKKSVEEYRIKVDSLQSVEVSKIYATMKELGINERICPICGKNSSLNLTYCSQCGWSFSPLDNINGLEYLADVDSQKLNLFKSLYTKISDKDSKQETALGLDSEFESFPAWMKRGIYFLKQLKSKIAIWHEQLIYDWKASSRNTNIITRILFYILAGFSLLLTFKSIILLVTDKYFTANLFLALFFGIFFIASINFIIGRKNGLFYLVSCPLIIFLMNFRQHLFEVYIMVLAILAILFAILFLPRNKVTSWSQFKQMNKWAIGGCFILILSNVVGLIYSFIVSKYCFV